MLRTRENIVPFRLKPWPPRPRRQARLIRTPSLLPPDHRSPTQVMVRSSSTSHRISQCNWRIVNCRLVFTHFRTHPAISRLSSNRGYRRWSYQNRSLGYRNRSEWGISGSPHGLDRKQTTAQQISFWCGWLDFGMLGRAFSGSLYEDLGHLCDEYGRRSERIHILQEISFALHLLVI